MPASTIASVDFLSQLKSLYPSSSPESPWYMVAAVAFNASNRPEEVAGLFKHLLTLPEFQAHDEKMKMASKIREAIFKSGVTSGFSRTINSLIALHEVTPEDLKEKKMMRELQPLPHYEEVGRDFFRAIYGDTADNVQKLLDDIYPDMGWFSNTIGYGLCYRPESCRLPVLSSVEVSYTLVATLISMDTARQAGWHLDGARRRGATIEEVEAVRKISMEVASKCGVTWREGVPEVTKGPLA